MGLLNEYIDRRMSGKDLEEELLRLIAQYNQLSGSFLFVYSAAIAKPIPAISMSMDDYYVIYDLLRTISSTKLDFYIETPGGKGEAAEEIARYLRTKFLEIQFIISGEAKSAGTLLALSGDEIVMTQSGSLGPIDAQVMIGRSLSSAYDYMEWVKEKMEEAAKVGKLNPFEATMIAQISPGELKGVNNALHFAKDMVVEWLPKYKFKNWNETETKKLKVTERMKKERAEELALQLMDHAKWRSHGRSLKIDDLKTIGLKVNKLDDNKELCEVVYKIQTVIKLLFSTTNTFKIFATEDSKIFLNATAGAPAQVKSEDPDNATFEAVCSQCKTKHSLYVKFKVDPMIDKKLQEQGFKQLSRDAKIVCRCGQEIDLTGAKNEIETVINKKIVF